MHWRTLSGAALLALLVGCSGQPTGGANALPDPVRTFRFTYEARIPEAPAGTRLQEIWLPLPVDDPGVQHVAGLEITTSDGSAAQQTRDARHGNRIAYLRRTAPTGPMTVRWSAVISRADDRGQGTLPTIPAHRLPNRLIPLDGEAAALARKLELRDAATPLRSRAHRVYDDVLDSMEYNKAVAGYGMGDFDRAVTVCKGNCTDFHARFIGTSRAGGIPCRFTMGVPLTGEPTGTYDSYHCWAHWHDGARWQPVDISEADKIVAEDPAGARRFFGHLGHDRVALSLGRDIVLEPPQKSPPLNYFVFPHVEADGRSVKLDKSMWTFTYANVPGR